MTAYTVTADATVVSGTASGDNITMMADDEAVFAGAQLYFRLTDGTVTHSMKDTPSGKGSLKSPGHTTIRPPIGHGWAVLCVGATASTNIKVSIA